MTEKRVLNWGLIGAGDVVRKRVAPALQELDSCNLFAVSRNNATMLDQFADEVGAERRYADWRELIADKDIDAVYIATPVCLHAEQAAAAAEHGKHVLCEKPMAINPEECERMIAAAQFNNVKLGIAYYRHFYPAIIRIKKILAGGEIGRVSVAQMNAFEYFDPAEDHPRRWLLDPAKSGGGPMMDFGCHRLEVLTNLFGDVSRIGGLNSNAVFNREVEDTSTALMHFENGTIASVTVTHAAIEKQDTLSIFGTRGSIHMQSVNGPEVRILVDGEERTESHPTHANVNIPLIEDFVAAIQEDRSPKVDAEVGRIIALLLEQILN